MSPLASLPLLLTVLGLASAVPAQESQPTSRPASRPASRPDPAPQREQERVDRLTREISALFVQLASEERETSRRARDAIIDLCGRERIDRLGYEAEKRYAAYRRRWVEVRREEIARAEQAIGIIDIRLQKSTLVGMDTVPVSLGVGNPVMIQLPRTQSIGIGTTVAVPLGTGR